MAQRKSIHAAEKWPVVDPSPRKQTVEAFAQGQLANPKPHFIMADRYLWPMIESKVSKVCVGIEAAKVGLAEIHQDLVRTFNIAAVFAIVRFYDGVRKRIVTIRSRQHLLHFEFRTRSPRDDSLGPIFDRLALLTPIMLAWIPRPSRFQFERGESQRRHIESHGFDLARKIGIPGIVPLLVWPENRDLTGNNIPKASCTECDVVGSSTDAAAGGLLLH